MQVIFIHHSCFLVEVDEKVLIFDWFAGDRVNGYTFRGQIPEYEPDTPIYVFASHKHRDHFDMDVLHWAERYSNIHYIFSKDCRMTPHFLEKHGFDLSVRELITYVSPCEKYQVDDLEIETLRSTDAGVAFYVKTNGQVFIMPGISTTGNGMEQGNLSMALWMSIIRTRLKNLQRKTSTWHLCRLIQNLGCISHLAWNIFWRTRMQSMCFQCICGRIIPGYSLLSKD